MAKKKIELKRKADSVNWHIIAIFLVGLLLRIFLAPLVNKGDMMVHFDWGKIFLNEGLKDSYFRHGFAYSFPTQPPLMNFLILASRWIFEQRFNLAVLHNRIKIPPAAILVWIDNYGYFLALKLWAIIGDLLSAGLLYYLINRFFSKRAAYLASAVYLFCPISLFISSIWGQNGLLAAFFAVLSLSLLQIGGNKNWLLAPPLFLVGLSIKPTVLLFFPLILFISFSKTFGSNKNQKSIQMLVVSTLVGLLLFLVSFYPFWNGKGNYLPFVSSVVEKRVMPSAKGASRASISAFNLHSLLFEIDKTPASVKIGPINAEAMGLLLVATVYLLSFYFYQKQQKRDIKDQIRLVFFLAYFIISGVFLLKTNMLERYFLAAFLPAMFLYFTTDSRCKIILTLQFLIWFVNLFYSFFWRDWSWMRVLFVGNSYLLIRLFSLANLMLFVFFTARFINIYLSGYTSRLKSGKKDR